MSLGFNCFPALQLERNKLRRWAFPFDWNITSMYGLYRLIENDFADFLNPDFLQRRGDLPGVFNAKYQVALAHDFPGLDGGVLIGAGVPVGNWLGALGNIQDKYQRRIERFKNVFNLANKVYFFRLRFTYWSCDNAPQDKRSVIKLKQILAKKFPTENWELIVVSDTKDYMHDWNIPQVRNFYIGPPTAGPMDPYDAKWTEVFKKLGLIP